MSISMLVVLLRFTVFDLTAFQNSKVLYSLRKRVHACTHTHAHTQAVGTDAIPKEIATTVRNNGRAEHWSVTNEIVCILASCTTNNGL